MQSSVVNSRPTAFTPDNNVRHSHYRRIPSSQRSLSPPPQRKAFKAIKKALCLPLSKKTPDQTADQTEGNVHEVPGDINFGALTICSDEQTRAPDGDRLPVFPGLRDWHEHEQAIKELDKDRKRGDVIPSRSSSWPTVNQTMVDVPRKARTLSESQLLKPNVFSNADLGEPMTSRAPRTLGRLTPLVGPVPRDMPIVAAPVQTTKLHRKPVTPSKALLVPLELQVNAPSIASHDRAFHMPGAWFEFPDVIPIISQPPERVHRKHEHSCSKDRSRSRSRSRSSSRSSSQQGHSPTRRHHRHHHRHHDKERDGSPSPRRKSRTPSPRSSSKKHHHAKHDHYHHKHHHHMQRVHAVEEPEPIPQWLSQGLRSHIRRHANGMPPKSYVGQQRDRWQTLRSIPEPPHWYNVSIF